MSVGYQQPHVELTCRGDDRSHEYSYVNRSRIAIRPALATRPACTPKSKPPSVETIRLLLTNMTWPMYVPPREAVLPWMIYEANGHYFGLPDPPKERGICSAILSWKRHDRPFQLPSNSSRSRPARSLCYHGRGYREARTSTGSSGRSFAVSSLSRRHRCTPPRPPRAAHAGLLASAAVSKDSRSLRNPEDEPRHSLLGLSSIFQLYAIRAGYAPAWSL